MTNLSKVREYKLAWEDLEGLPGFFRLPAPYDEQTVWGHFHVTGDVLRFMWGTKRKMSAPICNRSYWKSTIGPSWAVLNYTVDVDVIALLGAG